MHQIAGLQKQDPRAPPGGIAGNSGAVDAAADYREVEGLVHGRQFPQNAVRVEQSWLNERSYASAGQ